MTMTRTTALAITLPALLLASAGAAAQSSVRISGMIDLGVYRGFDEQKHVGTIQRSNIAFSGNEDLGGGLAATFALSHRFDADTGSAEGAGSKPFWQGESSVGLKGGFGHLRLGRALDVISANDWAYDPWGNFDRVASPAWNNWHWNYASSRTSNNGSPEYGRLADGVFYDSPAMGGFTVHLSGAFENSGAPGAGTGNNSGLSLNYGQGPVSAMLATSRNSSGDTIQFLGASMKTGALTLMGAFDHTVYKAVVDSTAKVYTFGATYAMGVTTLKAGYGHRDVDGASSRFVGLGADYFLSKRSNLYVSLGHQKPSSASGKTAYGAGIAHRF